MRLPKGQVVLPAQARRLLGLAKGERLSVELREGGILSRAIRPERKYRLERNPVSGLPVMVSLRPIARKATPEDIARLNADLLSIRAIF